LKQGRLLPAFFVPGPDIRAPLQGTTRAQAEGGRGKEGGATAGEAEQVVRAEQGATPRP